MKLRLLTALPMTSLLLVSYGCAPADDGLTGVPVMTDGMGHDHDHDHGHGSHPETLSEAVTQLTALRDTVRDAFAADDADTAHGPLHDVGHLLEEVSELGGKAKLSEEAKATIETNVETLLDAFGAVDKKMHSEDGSEGSDYKDVAEKIDTAIAAIVAAAGPALASDHGEHDHDVHDHKHEDHDEAGVEDHDHKDHADDEAKNN